MSTFDIDIESIKCRLRWIKHQKGNIMEGSNLKNMRRRSPREMVFSKRVKKAYRVAMGVSKKRDANGQITTFKSSHMSFKAWLKQETKSTEKGNFSDECQAYLKTKKMGQLSVTQAKKLKK